MESYNSDVLAWSVEQARLLREGRFDRLDIEHLADEIEDVGRSEKRALASRLAVLFAHLLKWQFQPALRSGSWERTIREQRKQVLRKLKEVPSLRPLLDDPDWMADAWSEAVVQATREGGIADLPEDCPWPVDVALADGWLPTEGAA